MSGVTAERIAEIRERLGQVIASGADLRDLADVVEDLRRAEEDARDAEWEDPESRIRVLEREVEHWQNRPRMAYPGVWLVTEEPGSSRTMNLKYLAEVPDPIPLAAIAQRIDAIASAILKARISAQDSVRLDPPNTKVSVHWTYPSAMDVARDVVRHLLDPEAAPGTW